MTCFYKTFIGSSIFVEFLLITIFDIGKESLEPPPLAQMSFSVILALTIFKARLEGS